MRGERWRLDELHRLIIRNLRIVDQECRYLLSCGMTAGVGTFGVLAGLIASWFLSPVAEEADKDREEIKELLLELKAIKQGRSARD